MLRDGLRGAAAWPLIIGSALYSRCETVIDTSYRGANELRRRGLKKLGRDRKLQISDNKMCTKMLSGSFTLNSHTVSSKNNVKFTHTLYICIKKLHFKLHSDTTLLLSVQPGFSECEGENFLPAYALSKKIFRQE